MIQKYKENLNKHLSLDFDFLTYMLQELLPEKRFNHVQGVRSVALNLAGIFNLIPQEAYQLELAVLFHDFARGMSQEELYSFALENNIILPQESHLAPAVYHAIIAAWIMEYCFHVKDRSVINAVYYHTTGSIHMDLTGQLLYLADYLDDSRGLDTAHIFQLLPQELNKALLTVVQEKIILVLKKKHYIHSDSINYYHFLLKKCSN